MTYSSSVQQEPFYFLAALFITERLDAPITCGSKQLRTDDVEASFCYYLDCYKVHEKVRDYINNTNKGYEKLKAYLEARDDHGVLLSLRHLARRWDSR